MYLEQYIPYRDIFDHKSPMIYFLSWQGMQISYFEDENLTEECAMLFYCHGAILLYKVFAKLGAFFMTGRIIRSWLYLAS